MAHSRLERIGTIYTRVTGLIRSGAMKLEDRPLWYEVYQAFPPATPPRYDNPAPKEEIRKIFYPEDVVRAKFYQKVASAPTTNLRDDGRPSPCQVFLENCQRLAVSKGLTMEDVFDEAFASTKESLQTSRESSRTAKSQAKRDGSSDEGTSAPKPSLKIDGIFDDELAKRPEPPVPSDRT